MCVLLPLLLPVVVLPLIHLLCLLSVAIHHQHCFVWKPRLTRLAFCCALAMVTVFFPLSLIAAVLSPPSAAFQVGESLSITPAQD